MEIRVRPTNEEEQVALIARCHHILNKGLKSESGHLDVRVWNAALHLKDLQAQHLQLSHQLRNDGTTYIAPSGGRIPTAKPRESATFGTIVQCCDEILDDYGIAIGLHYTLEGRIGHLIDCIQGSTGYVAEISAEITKANL